MLLYDVKRPYQIMLRYSGTLWQLVFSNTFFWTVLTVNVTIASLRMSGTLTQSSHFEIPADILATTGSLVAFSVVFFLDRVYSRFLSQVEAMRDFKGAVVELVTHGRVEMDRAHLRQMARYAVALFHLTFYDIAHVTNNRHFIEKELLTEAEYETLHSLPNNKIALLGCWLHTVIQSAYSQKLVADRELFTDNVSTMYRQSTALYNFHVTPPPLAYWHLMLVTLHAWLLMYAYASPFFTERPEDAWTCVVGFAIVMFAYLGMEAVAFVHIDPWGSDSTDLDMVCEMDDLFRQAMALVNADLVPVGLKKTPLNPTPPPIRLQDLAPITPSLPDSLLFLEQNTSFFRKYFRDARKSELYKMIEARHLTAAGSTYDVATAVVCLDKRSAVESEC